MDDSQAVLRCLTVCRDMFGKYCFFLSTVLLLLSSILPSSTFANSDPKAAALDRFKKRGVYDSQIISEDELSKALRAAYAHEQDHSIRDALAQKLLSLKWWRLWEFNWEMGAEHVLIGDPLDDVFQTDERWRWSPPQVNPFETNAQARRLHYSISEKGIARHRAQGVFPKFLPVNGSLEQEVYFPKGQIPEQIWLRVETIYVGKNKGKSTFVQARWTEREQHLFATENRPNSFWAGSLKPDSEHGGWQRLRVDLLDLGLCGRERAILGIEFNVAGGDAWFGRTIVRRPQVEVRGGRNYHLFFPGESLNFDVAAHNFSSQSQEYTLELRTSNYQGSELSHAEYTLTIPAHSTQHEPFVIPPGPSRYLLLDYCLRQRDSVVYKGHSSAAIIVPNETGRKARTKFGMMYWDHPGEEMVELYRKLGVKQIVIFPEKERLHLFNTGNFDVMPMIWTLPDGNVKEEGKLRKRIKPYLDAGQQSFSNFWETDLRVPADMFAPHMRRFFEIIKQIEPAATVGIGGMAWFNVAYVAQLVEAAKNSGRFFDFVALMSYVTPSPPEYSGLDQESDALLTLLSDLEGDAIELWNVEWSYFDTLNVDRGVWQNTSLAREDWVPYYIRHHLFGFASGIARMIPGSPFYAGRLPLAKNYGHSMVLGGDSLFRYDLSPLPLLPAYSTMTRMLEGKAFVRNLSKHPDVHVHLYEAYDKSYKRLSSVKNILAFWTPFERKNIRLKFPQSLSAMRNTPFRIVNMLGEVSEITSSHGELQLSLSPEPQYLLLPDAEPDELRSLEIIYAEPLLSLHPKTIELSPETPQSAILTCQVFNSGDDAIQGQVRLTQPDWMRVVGAEVRYGDEIGVLLAEKMLQQTTQPLEAPFIYLGRRRKAEVLFEVEFPDRIRRHAYYEQSDLTQQPSFPVSAEFFSEGAILARAESVARVLPALSAVIRPILSGKQDAQHPQFEVRVTNHSVEARQGRLKFLAHAMMQIEPSAIQFALEPGETQAFHAAIVGEPGLDNEYVWETVDTRLQRRRVHVRLKQEEAVPLDHYQKSFGYLVSHGIGEGYVIEALLQDQLGYEQRLGRGWAFRPAVRAKKAPVIDARFDDWNEASPLFVHPEGRLGGLTFFAEMYGRKMQWDGLEDFSSAWQMMWDEKYLYLAVKVFDDRFVPQHELGSFWNGDSLSFQIDPRPELTDASLLPRPRDLRDVHTFDIALSRTGPKIRRKYSGEAVAGVELAIQTVPDAVLYEAAIPWEELRPLRPEKGGWMGCSFVFYEDDGYGRETKSQWFGGSGGNGLAREPRLMGDVHFVE